MIVRNPFSRRHPAHGPDSDSRQNGETSAAQATDAAMDARRADGGPGSPVPPSSPAGAGQEDVARLSAPSAHPAGRTAPAADTPDVPAGVPRAAGAAGSDERRTEVMEPVRVPPALGFAPMGEEPARAPAPMGAPGSAAWPLGGEEPARLSELEARGVSAWFGDHKVLDRVSLGMPAGQVTALIGPSGCGKSTFLRILNRMHERVRIAKLAGEVMLDGQDIYGPERKVPEIRRDIGMVFQRPNPFPAMSIYDNVVAGLKLTGTRASRDEKDQLVETALGRAGLWEEVKDRLASPGGGLSGGQQQRLCIARSLAIRPKVLLMDEPCSALDPTSTRVIEETMTELRKEVTIVIVTHNMQQAERVSQRCAFFLASMSTPGRIVEYGDTQAVFHDPQDQRTKAYVAGQFG